MDDVNFVADDDDGDSEIDFENSLTKGHIHAHIHVFSTHVGIKVVKVARWLRLEFLFARDDQVTIIINLGFLVRLHDPLNLLLHGFVFAYFHVGKNREQGLAQS